MCQCVTKSSKVKRDESKRENIRRGEPVHRDYLDHPQRGEENNEHTDVRGYETFT